MELSFPEILKYHLSHQAALKASIPFHCWQPLLLMA